MTVESGDSVRVAEAEGKEACLSPSRAEFAETNRPPNAVTCTVAYCRGGHEPGGLHDIPPCLKTCEWVGSGHRVDERSAGRSWTPMPCAHHECQQDCSCWCHDDPEWDR